MTPSAHSDHRPQDIRFARQQSREMAGLAWEDRRKVIHTWRGDIAAAIAVVLLGILAFPAAELVSAIVAGL